MYHVISELDCSAHVLHTAQLGGADQEMEICEPRGLAGGGKPTVHFDDVIASLHMAVQDQLVRDLTCLKRFIITRACCVMTMNHRMRVHVL